MTFDLKYVPLSEVGAYLAQGWIIADDMATCHHAVYSVIMRRDVK